MKSRLVLRLVELFVFGGAGVLAACGHWQGTLEMLGGYCFGRGLAEYVTRELGW